MSGMGSEYGYHLDPARRAALRGPVPAESIAWVERSVGGRVVGQRALEGGTSSAVHLLDLEAHPTLDRVVLRRYVLPWTREEPWIPGNEAQTLRWLADHQVGVPVPRLLASDPDGSAVGVPATLMTASVGATVWEPDDRTSWLRALAEVVVSIHAVPTSTAQLAWAPYPPDSRTPPVWSAHPDAWRTAYRLWEGPTPPSRRVFLHRDFHPGNVLWNGDRITGVVDWTSSCAGPPEEDIGHCRANLAIRHGQDCADEFLTLWQDLSGTLEYHPYWDLTNVVSFDHRHDEPGLDAFVAAAAGRV